MKLTKLGAVCQIIMGQSPPSTTYNNKSQGLPFFQGKTDFSEKYPSVRVWCNSPKKIAEKGDILMSVRAPVGPVNIADRQCAIGRGICAIRPSNEVITEYLFYVLRSKEQEIAARGLGSTFQAINKDVVSNIEIPLVSLPEQQRIVSKLDRAERLKELRQQANSETDNYLQAAFFAIINNSKYRSDTLGNHTIKTETVNPLSSPNENLKYVDIAGINNKKGIIQEYKTILGQDAPSRARRLINKNDVIVSTVRPNLNATAIVPEVLDGEVCSTGFCVLRCAESLNPKFLYVFTRTKYFIDALSSKMKGASYPAVTNENVLSVKIPLPPIAVQDEFAALVDSIMSVKRNQEQSMKEINTLFESLMQKSLATIT